MNRELSLNKISNFIDTGKRIQCKACGLHLNQMPVVDSAQKASVFWVGLSAVYIPEDKEKLPLSPYTRSGALISEIEKSFSNEILFYKTNIVKCLPLNNDKIRYPLKHEMEKCYPNLILEIETLNPKFIFLLGRQVGSFVFDKLSKRDVLLSENFNYHSIMVNNINYVQIHHPSYVLVYKRKFIKEYINGISSLINSQRPSNTTKKSIRKLQYAD